MDLSSAPWQSQVFDATFRGPVQITAPLEGDTRRLSLSGEGGHAHVELDTEGFWRQSRVSLPHAKIGRAPDSLFGSESLFLSAERPRHPPKDHTQSGLTLEGSADDIVLPETMLAPFGPKMAHLAMTLRVMGDVPDFRKRDSVEAWNNAGGIVNFDNLQVGWGTLGLTASGTIGFDDDLQPEGAFSSAMTDPRAVMKELMVHNFIAPRQEGMLNSALSLFAKSSKSVSGIELPITIQLGGFFLGPVRIFMFPAIAWPKVSVEPADQSEPAAATTP